MSWEDLTPLAYLVAVVALLLGYTIGRGQELVLDWLHDLFGVVVSALVYVLVVLGVAAVAAVVAYALTRG